MTTHAQATGVDTDAVLVEPMSPEIATLFLLRRSGIIEASVSLFSLVHLNSHTAKLRMYPLVQTLIQEMLTEDERQSYARMRARKPP